MFYMVAWLQARFVVRNQVKQEGRQSGINDCPVCIFTLRKGTICLFVASFNLRAKKPLLLKEGAMNVTSPVGLRRQSSGSS